MISYILEVSICLAMFYLLYRLVLSKVKLLSLNRVYLLASALLSFIIPLIKIPISEEVPSVPLTLLTQPGRSIDMVSAMERTPAEYLINPWLCIYIIGLIIAVIYTIKSFHHIHRLIQHPKVKTGDYWHVQTDQASISSFFGYIFLPADFDKNTEEARLALAHEEVHLKQKHSLDLIFFQLMSVVFWFHPLVYAYKRAITLEHEYIADDVVSRKLGRQSYTQRLIEVTLTMAGLPFTHSFSQHPVEKRLKMIETLNPTKMKKFKIMTLGFALLALLMLSISCVQTKYVQLDSQGNAEEISAEQYEELLQQKPSEPEAFERYKIIDPLGPAIPNSISGKVQAGKTGAPLDGVSIIKMPGGTAGTMTNPDGEYRVALTKADTSLLFRKKGFQDMVIPRHKFSVINVALQEVEQEGN